MAEHFLTEDSLLKLDVSGEIQLGSMISGLPPARPSTITRVPSSRTIGQPGLPPELLLQVLQPLDFRSLSRLSRTSLAAKAAVESLPAYQDMVAHAPEVLTALSKTQLIEHHSANHLHQTLRSSRCTSCGAFGGFIFLPTCERACYECLETTRDMRVTKPEVAKERFRLTLPQVWKLRHMHGISGMYGPVEKDPSYRKECKLVFVRDAMRFAIETHGSEEAVDEMGLPWGRPASVHWWLSGPYQSFVEGLLGHRDKYMSVAASNRGAEEAYFGMASTRFPSVTGDRVEHGHLCRGCWFRFRNWDPHEDAPRQDDILREACRLWSGEEFLEHVRICGGVRRALEQGEFS